MSRLSVCLSPRTVGTSVSLSSLLTGVCLFCFQGEMTRPTAMKQSHKWKVRTHNLIFGCDPSGDINSYWY